MRALTVRQPWAWAIVHGQKDVENRTRNIAGSYRGPVAIHVALAMATDAADLWPVGMPLPLGRYARETGGTSGHIVGVVDLVDVHNHEWPRVNSPQHAIPATCPSVWAMADHHHLVFANPRPLARSIPYRGRLGLWTLPDDIEARIREQVAS